MAKAKARRRVRDTWKEKSWYTIKTPVNFEDKEIGEPPAKKNKKKTKKILSVGE